MVDFNINNQTDLRTFDFAQNAQAMTDDEVKTLLGGNANGKVTIDKQGQLVVLRPDAKLDNAFVRFFKGLTIGEKGRAYRNEQSALLNYLKLSRNVNFSNYIKTQVANYASSINSASMQSQGLSADKIQRKTFEFNKIVNTVLGQNISKPEELTVGSLKQAISNSQKIQDRSLAQVKDFSFGMAGCNDLIHYQGKVMNALSFVTQGVPYDSTTIGDLPSKKSLTNNLVALVMQDNSGFLSNLCSAEDKSALKELMCSKDLRGAPSNAITAIEAKITNKFLVMLGKTAENYIKDKFDSKAVSNLLANALISGASANSPEALHDLFFNEDALALKLDPQTPKSEIASQISPEIQALRDSYIQNARDLGVLTPEVNAHLDDIINFCEQSHHDPKQFFANLASFKPERFLGKALTPSDLLNIIDAAQTGVSNATALLHKADPGADDLISIFKDTLFFAYLNNPSPEHFSDFVEFSRSVGQAFDCLSYSVIDMNNTQGKNVGTALALNSATSFIANYVQQGMTYFNSITDLNNLDNNQKEIIRLALQSGYVTDSNFLNQFTANLTDPEKTRVNNYIANSLLMDMTSGEFKNLAIPFDRNTTATLKEAAQKLFDKTQQASINAIFNMAKVEHSELPSTMIQAWTEDLCKTISEYHKESLKNDGFYPVLAKDVERGEVHNFNGVEINKNFEILKDLMLKEIPHEFLPAISTALMQGGMCAVISIPYMLIDGEHASKLYPLPGAGTATAERLMYDFPNHYSDVTVKDQQLVINHQIDMVCHPLASTEPIAVTRYNTTITVDLAAGVDENGIPKAMTMTSIANTII